MKLRRIIRKLRSIYYLCKYRVSVVAHGPFNICYPENVNISECCSINHGVFILGYIGIDIGKNVTLSARCMLLDSGLDLSLGEVRKHKCAKIEIGDNVWIGANAIILSGVTIGEGAVVAAGSIVNKNVSANTLVAGNPARFIKGL